MWDDASWGVLSTRQLELVRRSGDLSALPFVLADRSSVFAFLGDLKTSELLEQEIESGVGGDRNRPQRVRSPVPHSSARRRGRILGAGPERGRRGAGAGRGGRPHRHRVSERSSLQRARSLRRRSRCGDPAEPFYKEGPAIWALTELIEAAVRCEQPERAQRAFERVQETTAPPAPTGRSGSRPACARCSATATTPRSSTGRRSSDSVAPPSASSSPGLTCSTASGCGASAAASTLASSCGPLTSSSGTSGWRRSLSARTRAGGNRRACPKADGRYARPAHAAGVADRASRRGRRDQSRDRRPAVHQCEHRRVPPPKGIPQARRQVTQSAQRPTHLGRRVREGGSQLPAGGDPELREHAVKVGADRAVREEELLNDLAVRQAPGRELSDLQLLGGQLVARLGDSAPAALARCP